jgi:hypothetical protein
MVGSAGSEELEGMGERPLRYLRSSAGRMRQCGAIEAKRESSVGFL